MDACIGAARALRQSFFAGEVFESGHQRPLNGQSIGLDLPPGEVVAIISEREFEISQVAPGVSRSKSGVSVFPPTQHFLTPKAALSRYTNGFPQY